MTLGFVGLREPMVAKKKTEDTTIQIEDSVTPRQVDTETNNTFSVVGIGASAGGLGAFEEFFKAMPENSGMAFVLVSHLDPHHVSILPDLIQKKTSMKVSQVSDNIRLVPNQVFIIPPNKEIVLFNGALQLLEMSVPRRTNLPIDIFFRSLAQDMGERAIGIILSGTGTDGTIGLRSIKSEGGLVIAQEPGSAKYDGMPRSAINTGLVDYILPPGKMPEQLLNYVRHLVGKQTDRVIDEDDALKGVMQKVFVLLRAATNHDFSLYKSNTIHRRIERRMHVHQIDTLKEYVRYLQESEHEITILYRELLIGVTSFFRDSDAFVWLQNTYIAEIVKNKLDDDNIRIWVPGCSTGEEVYSIAIIFQECMEAMQKHFSVQIFGTDLNVEAIEEARTGIYSDAVCADVSPERLKKFFTREEGHYRIRKSIRDVAVFAPQNIIKDPPFTKLDMLSCRNLLIYFGSQLQKKVMPLFHYSLKPDGLLLLGPSETIGQFTDLFTPLDKKWKIFKRSTADNILFTKNLRFSPSPTPIPPYVDPDIQGLEEKKIGDSRSLGDVDSLKLLNMIIAQSDMSTCVIIDDHGNILYIHGRTGRYLEPAEGEANFNILEMARPGLRTGLTQAIRKLATERREVTVKGMQVQDQGGYLDFSLTIRPLPRLQAVRRGLMMVIFEETPIPESKKANKTEEQQRVVGGDELSKLEKELQYTKENLQSTIEELETSNEELKSTNEELQSTNEELQSTNEELETSKEELQSLNEESATVNSELQGRIDELVTANDDMNNLLDATEIATIFLDINLNIRRFTSKATELIPLTTVDIGRPISHFSSKLKDVDLSIHAQTVLQDLGKLELEVQDTAGATYRMRLRPYRTTNNVIDGVVIIFDDITEMKKLTQAKRLAAIVNASSEAIALHDLTGNILAWNKGAVKMFGYSETEALQMNIFDTVSEESRKEVKAIFTSIKKDDEARPISLERKNKDGVRVPVWLTITLINDENDRPEFIATMERDLNLLNKEALHNLTGDPHGTG